MVRIERVIILVLGMALLKALWKLHRNKVKQWWKGVKDRLPRHWRPKSPADCPSCQLEARSELYPEPQERPGPYAASKSARGRKKQLKTEGWACLNMSCEYYGETDASRHAVIGHGKIGRDKTIQRLKCAACETTFSSRKGTPLYYAKTEPEMMGEVLWWLAEGVDVSVLVRRFGYEEETIAQWLTRAGEHGQHLHAARFRDLSIVLIQMDELYAKVKEEEKARWVWLAIDPVSKALPALHLGGRRWCTS